MKRIVFWRQSQSRAGKILFLTENANKALGYLRNLIISWSIGFGGLSDLYFLVFGIASAISGIITGALNATFVPYSQSLACRQRRLLLGGIAIVCTAIYLLISTPTALMMVYGSSSPQLRELAGSLSGVIIIAGLIAGFMAIQLIQIADEFLRSRKNFILGGGMLLVVNTLAVLVLHFGLADNAWLLGLAVSVPALLLVGVIYGCYRLARLSLRQTWPYLIQASPLVVSGSVGMVNIFIDRWFASGFDAGRLSIMQTALMLITQIGAVAVSPLINAAYPFFSASYVGGKQAEADRSVAAVELRIMVYLAVFMVAYAVLGNDVLRLIYERGQVTAANVGEIHHTGNLYFSVLVYGSVVGLYLRVLYCHSIVKLPAMLSVMIILINIALNIIFVPQMGWQALAYSACFCAWLYFGVIVYLLRRHGLYRVGPLRLLLLNAPIAHLVIYAGGMQ